MRHYRFEDWCNNAVSGIGFPPDREKVYRELYAHMEDRYDALRAQGTEPGDAENQVYDAMGDAFAVGKQLSQIHKPFWGYCLRITRWILALALIVTLIPTAKYIWENRNPHIGPDHGYDIYDPEAYGSDTGRTLRILYDPDITIRDSGYTYNVDKALLWENSDGETFLYLHLTMRNFLPWALFPDWDNDPLDALYAVDSRGTHYHSQLERYIDRNVEQADFICIIGGQTDPFTREYTVWVNYMELENNDWIEFIYDRDGRNHVIHIRLPGGDGK